MSGGSRPCEVCKETKSKYKCPSCLVPYCSLSCFKKHKENPCEKPVVSEEKLCIPLLPEKSLLVDVPSLQLQKAQLESIVVSEEICDALKNEELQKLIAKIDSSPIAENELDKAMEIEVFRKFTEQILSVISP